MAMIVRSACKAKPIEAAADARELAERTGTPLVVREVKKNQAGNRMGNVITPTKR